MDPRYLPSDIILALRQVAMSGALTPEERAEINTWLAGGAQPRSTRVTQGINNVLRTHNMPTLTGEPQPSQAQGAAPIAGPPQPPSPNAALNTPAGPTPAQPRAPMLPVGTNTAPNAAPERAGNQTTPGLGSGFGAPPDGPGAGGSSPVYTPPGGGAVSDGPGAGGSSPVYTPPNPLQGLITDGPGAGGGLPPTYASPGPAPAPAPAGGGSTIVSPTGPVNGNQFGNEVAYGAHPDQWLDDMLRKIGIDMANPGLYGQDIKNTIGAYIPNMKALLGLAPGALANVDTQYGDMVNTIAQNIGGGHFFSGLQQMAGNAKDNALGVAQRLGDPQQQQEIVQALLDLGTAGQNDYLRQAQGDDLMRSTLGFARTARDKVGTSAYPTNYVDWMRQQTDPRYRAVLQLVGGK